MKERDNRKRQGTQSYISLFITYNSAKNFRSCFHHHIKHGKGIWRTVDFAPLNTEPILLTIDTFNSLKVTVKADIPCSTNQQEKTFRKMVYSSFFLFQFHSWTNLHITGPISMQAGLTDCTITVQKIQLVHKVLEYISSCCIWQLRSFSKLCIKCLYSIHYSLKSTFIGLIIKALLGLWPVSTFPSPLLKLLGIFNLTAYMFIQCFHAICSRDARTAVAIINRHAQQVALAPDVLSPV